MMSAEFEAAGVAAAFHGVPISPQIVGGLEAELQAVLTRRPIRLRTIEGALTLLRMPHTIAECLRGEEILRTPVAS